MKQLGSNVCTDWFYRRPARVLNTVIVGGVARVFDWTERVALRAVHELARLSRNPLVILQIMQGEASSAPTQSSGYDPDVARSPLGSLLTLVLLSAVGLCILSILWLMMPG